MRELPFNYDITGRYLAARYGIEFQSPDFQDRYHDTLEMFIRHWNGQGNPVGAVSLMFSQWYTHHRKAKYHSLVATMQDLHEHERLGLPFEDESDGSREFNVDGVVEVDLTDGIQIQELRTVIHQVLSTQSDRNKVLFLMHLKEHTSSEIALELGIKRQRVEFIIARTLESIKKVLVQ